MQIDWVRNCGFTLNFLAIFAAFSWFSTAAAADDDIFPDMSAEYVYRESYAALNNHKAFAIGPYGAFGYSYHWPSVKAAERDALATCERDVKISRKKLSPDKKAAGKCKLLASDGKLLLAAPWIGPEWQTPLDGPDLPLQQGKSSIYKGALPKGILLYVHGCSGLGWDRMQDVYADFFNALGFSYFAPNSFAEPRPAAICGEYAPSKIREQKVLTKLRIAQTLRTIRDLKIKYPGQPIYLWGHSEGGHIVKMLDVEVAGIITSGDACDVFGQKMLAQKAVPVLIMNGENDPYHGSIKLPLTVKKMQNCRNYVKNSNAQIVVLKNNKHDIHPWRSEFYQAVPKFLGVGDFVFPSELPAGKSDLNDVQQAEMPKYASKPTHRAFAASAQGEFSWTSEWEFVEDAEQFALYDCAAQADLNLFALKSQYCFLSDVDGKKIQGK